MHGNSIRVLLIDRTPESLNTISDPLKQRGYTVVQVPTAREGLERIYLDSPDVILLARDLPDMDGLFFCSELKNDLVLRHIPLILLDFEPFLEGELSAREAGAEDYLHRPVDMEELHGRIHQILLQGTVGLNCHPVTGLPGHATVYRKVQETLEKAGPFAVCFLDIHELRHFNQRYGYAKGDEILRETALRVVQILHASGRHLDFFGHLGSDDFVLITDPDCVEDLCTRIVERFEHSLPDFYEPVELQRGYIFTEGRDGSKSSRARTYLSIAIITDNTGRSEHVARVIEQGTELLSWAKRQGKSFWVKERRHVAEPQLFDQDADEAGGGTGSTGAIPRSSPGYSTSQQFEKFREILRTEDLKVHFQPIVFLDSGRRFGYEALLRGPAGSYFESPVILFSIARKLDMELELDLICLRQLQKVAGTIHQDAKVFYNVSPNSFSHPMFREFCESAAQDLLPERVVLEVTHKGRILDYPRFRESARYFKDLGYRLAVDDAQAGTVSLRTILELDPDYIKTDITVTRGIHEDPIKQEVFRKFCAFCNRQGIDLVAEGVESEQEKQYLKMNGARLAQGFLFSPALPTPA
jgi:diguanylate cyclase (GGDEF)-like protein